MFSATSEGANSSNSASPRRDLITDNAVGFSERNFSSAALETNEDALFKGTPVTFKSPLTSIPSLIKTREKCEDSHNFDTVKKKSHVSPDNYGHFRYPHWQQSDVGDIRHQLLVQRMFNNHDDHPEPRTSSPLRKIRICTVASGMQTVTVSPSSGTLPHCTKNSGALAVPSHEMQEIFKTPNRNQHRSCETTTDVYAAHPLTPSMLSPAGTPSYGFTPGRQFFNPFELDHDKMGMSIYSPNMFRVTDSVSNGMNKGKEAFWSVEHAAMMMPVDIKEAEIHFQHQHQQRRDREQDARMQSAINNFFSNEHIVPSPWSEKVTHFLPRTPGSVRSVSSQTIMSVPPHINLFDSLEGKYLLPDYMAESSPASDSFATSFIRRKLLNQLNDNDSELFSSPSFPARTTAEGSGSPSPIKQTTPEWERSTPSKIGTGHFSSSPIRKVPDEKGHHHGLSERDLLASPDLSPVAGRMIETKRSSGIFCSHRDEFSPIEEMNLDFSSILEDQDDRGVGVNDKSETLLQKATSSQHNQNDSSTKMEALSASGDPQCLISSVSHDSDGNSNNSKLGTGHSHRSALTSALSMESTSDTASHMIPQFSQDTGYQTASLQTTNYDSASNPNLTSQDVAPSVLANQKTDLPSFPVSFSSDMFTDLKQTREHTFNIKSPKNVTKLRYKSNRSFDADGSFLGLAFESSKSKSSSADDVALLRKNDEPCRFRKVRTVSDMRHLKEKSSVSRDLIQSFNEEQEKSNTATRSSWLDQNPDSFIPIDSKMIGQGIASQHISSESSPYTKDFSVALLKRPDDNDNAHDVPNGFDVSMCSASSFFNSSIEKKILNISNDMNLPEKINTSYEYISSGRQHSKFLLEDDSSLKEARLLLGRSEELWKKFNDVKTLESDSLYQAISSGIENEDPLIARNFLFPLKETESRSQTPSFKLEPVDSSTPTSRMLDSVKKKIDQVEGSKLGSEIAAEILKRASEDLAKLTSMLGYDKK